MFFGATPTSTPTPGRLDPTNYLDFLRLDKGKILSHHPQNIFYDQANSPKLSTTMAAEKYMETGASALSTHCEITELSEKVAEHAKLGDEETSRYVGPQTIEIDAATNKQLFWKINRRILPIMVVTYFCQSLDKGTLNFASIMGIQKDANLKGQEVCASTFSLKRY